MTPLARRLRASRTEIVRLIADAGGTDVRVFVSVARGDDSEVSDVDLLFAMRRPMSLLDLGHLQERIAQLVQASVDLVPESSLRPAAREQALTEAVALSGSSGHAARFSGRSCLRHVAGCTTACAWAPKWAPKFDFSIDTVTMRHGPT
jgi:predicted nucleotidyltransferase